MVPGMTIVMVKWAEYRTISALQEADYAAWLRLPHGEPNCRFMVPRINTHTQNIEAAWGPFKSFLVRKMKGSSGLGADTQQGQAKAYQILQRYPDWYWRQSLNGPAMCKELFLPRLYTISKLYPQC